jgi:kinetochore protein Nuf2
MASPLGTFPILQPHELLSDLSSCECPITADDLSHPTPARVQAVYEYWMSKMLGLNAEDVRRAADAQLDQLDHPVSERGGRVEMRRTEG